MPRARLVVIGLLLIAVAMVGSFWGYLRLTKQHFEIRVSDARP